MCKATLCSLEMGQWGRVGQGGGPRVRAAARPGSPWAESSRHLCQFQKRLWVQAAGPPSLPPSFLPVLPAMGTIFSLAGELLGEERPRPAGHLEQITMSAVQRWWT